MATYSIKEFSLITGIKAHTIRIWEKRYSLFDPSRTDTNIRRYTAEDLRLGLNIVSLLNAGYRIGRIAKLTNEEIADLLVACNKYVQPPPLVEEVLKHAIECAYEPFEEIIKKTIDENGLEWTFENLMVPFQKRMGLLWQLGTVSVALEHLTTNFLRHILIAQAQNVKIPYSPGHAQIVFFLPKGEKHELSLLYFNYIARKQGFQTIYLGSDMPIEQVKEVARKMGSAFLFTSLSLRMSEDEFTAIFNDLGRDLPQVKIFATGGMVKEHLELLPNRVIPISNAQQFKDHLL